MSLSRLYHRARAFFTGRFWLPCPVCHREFGGHEKGGGIFWTNNSGGQITCPNCPGQHGTPPKYLSEPIPVNEHFQQIYPSGPAGHMGAQGWSCHPDPSPKLPDCLKVKP